VQTESLRSVLEQDHHEIDEGVEPIVSGGAVTAEQRKSLVRAIDALRRHIYAEEELLFPALRAAGLVGPILVMLREHAEMWQSLDALDRLLESGATGDDALPVLCRQLFGQLQAHNPKEETILYPQADSALSAEEVSRVRAFLDSGQLPEGWMCRHLQV